MGYAHHLGKVAVDLRATVPKATPTARRPEVDGYLSEAIYTVGCLLCRIAYLAQIFINSRFCSTASLSA